ncbi:hypothetical protein chiPu_0017577 [Chiloscyllium punctatum]|uniref:Ig-like domain-containing protein n=1 Tax=Chiloscyllium punctatum TaxID=137246 RepID=A0A401RHD2_CHIPU|nr:hypothetical protein [Chiloscyllium punctatum]
MVLQLQVQTLSFLKIKGNKGTIKEKKCSLTRIVERYCSSAQVMEKVSSAVLHLLLWSVIQDYYIWNSICTAELDIDPVVCSPSFQAADRGESVFVHCVSGDSRPLVEIRLSKDRRTVSEELEFQGQYSHKNPFKASAEEHIANVSEEDNRNCSSVTYNPILNVTTHSNPATLKVKALTPKLHIIKSPEDITVASGKTASVHCAIQGFHWSNVTWFKNNKPLNGIMKYDDSQHILMLRNMSFEDEGFYHCEENIRNEIVTSQAAYLLPAGHQMLLIPRVNLTDEGLYNCVASSTLGQDERTGRLKVHVPPSILFLNASTLVRHGLEFTLFCDVSGIPKPNVFWFFKNRPLIASNQPNFLTENGILKIRKAMQSFEGIYECEAVNEAGSAKRSVAVYIDAPVQDQLTDDCSLAASDSSAPTSLAPEEHTIHSDILTAIPFHSSPATIGTSKRGGTTPKESSTYFALEKHDIPVVVGVTISLTMIFSTMCVYSVRQKKNESKETQRHLLCNSRMSCQNRDRFEMQTHENRAFEEDDPNHAVEQTTHERPSDIASSPKQSSIKAITVTAEFALVSQSENFFSISRNNHLQASNKDSSKGDKQKEAKFTIPSRSRSSLSHHEDIVKEPNTWKQSAIFQEKLLTSLLMLELNRNPFTEERQKIESLTRSNSIPCCAKKASWRKEQALFNASSHSDKVQGTSYFSLQPIGKQPMDPGMGQLHTEPTSSDLSENLSGAARMSTGIESVTTDVLVYSQLPAASSLPTLVPSTASVQLISVPHKQLDGLDCE